jgi:hypothetical protein
MSIILRIALIVVSFLVVVFVLRKIRKTQLHIDDAIYWIVSAGLLLIISIFPQIAIFASELLEIESPANFVFLFMIFMIVIKLFNLAIDLSIQKQRLNRLVQKLALLHDRNGLDVEPKEKD